MLLVNLSFAQKATPTLTAGDELLKAKKHFYTGSVIGLAGVALAGLGVASDVGTGPVYMGAVVSFVGVLVVFESFSHIGKAGVLLNESKNITLNTTKYGATLALRF